LSSLVHLEVFLVLDNKKQLTLKASAKIVYAAMKNGFLTLADLAHLVPSARFTFVCLK